MAHRNSIWVLCSDPQTTKLIQTALLPDFQVLIFARTEGLRRSCTASSQKSDLLLLDLDVSEDDPIEFLATCRPPDSFCPTVLITAKDDIETLRLRRRTSAVDLLLKPLNANELRAKIEAAMTFQARSLKFALDLLQSFGPDLTFTEQKILSHFLLSEDLTIQREEVFLSLWPNSSVNPKTFDVHLFNLRKKISAQGFSIVPCGRAGQWKLKKEARETGDSPLW